MTKNKYDNLKVFLCKLIHEQQVNLKIIFHLFQSSIELEIIVFGEKGFRKINIPVTIKCSCNCINLVL